MVEQKAHVSVWQRLVFWLLLPVSGLQGLLLRKSARRLAPPPGEVSGTCGEGRSIRLLAIGDSIIAGTGAHRQDQTLPLQFAQALSSRLGARIEWRTEGKNGLNLVGLVMSVAALEPGLPADVILLSIGVNDVTGLSTTGRWRRQLHLLANVMRSRWPRALVVFTGLPPMGQFPLPPQPLRFSLGLRAETFDRIAQEVFAGQNRMMHIQTSIQASKNAFCEDGFHPSAESYTAWAEALASKVAVNLQLSDVD